MKFNLQILTLLVFIFTTYNCEKNNQPLYEEKPDSLQPNTTIYFSLIRHAGLPATREEASLVDDLNAGKSRALISWYVIDPVFLRFVKFRVYWDLVIQSEKSDNF